MTKLSATDVRHIAKLCRLTLSETEVEKFTTELTLILTYIERLQKVDTKNVEALGNVTGLHNSFREDNVRSGGPTRDELLGCSPLPIVEQQIQTPSAHG